MSLTYGFYNSVNNDRAYNADQMSSIFDGVVADGIYMSIGGKMMVKTNNEMTLKISSGRAWFNHTWSYNDSDVNITIDNSDPLLNRIDAVVLEIDHSIGVRANSFKIVKGTPATNPTRPSLINNINVKQYPLAYVYIAAGATNITQANITNMVGTSSTPYVKGVIENISIDDMLAQWQAEFDEWLSELQAVLDENVAAHLQNEINDLQTNLNGKLDKSGGTMTGNLVVSGANIYTSNNGKYSGAADLTTNSTAVTQAAADNSTKIATTQFVKTESATKQNKVDYSNTDDVVPGTTSLTTGNMKLIYE